MSTRKYTDWRSWYEGIVDSAVPAGATCFLTLVGTNGAAHMFGGIFADVGMTWKQALAQIGVHMAIATAKYVSVKPRPVVVVEDFKTEMVEKPIEPKSDG